MQYIGAVVGCFRDWLPFLDAMPSDPSFSQSTTDAVVARPVRTVSLPAPPSGNPLSADVFRQAFARQLLHRLTATNLIPASEVAKVEKLATLLDTEPRVVAGWLSGRSLPDAFDLYRLSQVIGVSLDELLNNNSSQTAVPSCPIDEQYELISLHDLHPEEEHSIYLLPETLRYLRLPRRTSMLMMSDSAMSPLLQKGDGALYDPRVVTMQDNGLYVLRSASECIVRELHRVSPTIVRVSALNADSFPAFEAPLHTLNALKQEKDSHRIFGKVIGRLLLHSPVSSSG